MQETTNLPRYLYIALDLARRIAKKELPEGSKVYGRSTMASEYGVSPETIRRAMKLLADMAVVEIVPQSGVFVRSSAKANQYLERFGHTADLSRLKGELDSMLRQHQLQGQKIQKTAAAIARLSERLNQRLPFLTYNVPVKNNSWTIGQSFGDLKLWQATGCTVIAIQRGSEFVLSPGPYAQIQAGDRLLVVGEDMAVDALERFLDQV